MACLLERNSGSLQDDFILTDNIQTIKDKERPHIIVLPSI
jgi:hypothetical protein